MMQASLFAGTEDPVVIALREIDLEAHTPEPSNTVEAVRLACKAIDKTAERGIIHRNQASRRKSRLMKRANKAASAA